MNLSKLAGDPAAYPGVAEVASEGYIRADDLPANGDNPMGALLGANWAAGSIVLDFSKVTGIGSAGIGWLLQLKV